MRKLSPQRRKVVLLASSSALFATMPLLLLSGLHGITRQYVFGIGIGISLPLLVAAMILIKRNNLVCQD